MVFEGNFEGKGIKVAIVCGRSNEFITSKLLGGAKDSLLRHGVAEEDIDIAWVPGAFEMPVVVQKLVKKDYDAAITLGAVIRGATPHFDYVCSEVSKGVAHASMESGKPVMFGVLTVNSIEEPIS